MLYKVGITGNICSGKSSCLKFLSKMPHSTGVNFDILGHTVYSRNLIFLDLIKKVFSRENKNIFFDEGNFSEKFVRKELGKVVFENKKKLDTLNCLIKPEMRKLLNLYFRNLESKLKAENKKGIIFVEGAIIIEGGIQNLFDEVWLTVASKEEVEKRFRKRLEDNKVTEYKPEVLEKILKYQLPNEEKMKYCSEVIDTSNDFEITKTKYLELYNKLKEKLELS